ncbi:MAG: PBP1A family penicillin-binding protein [Altererythrobacter sp.]|nr:PBP1A family penicillin-binding protein [Altererythrobacter sp.]
MAQQKRGARTANQSKGKPPRKRWQVWLRRALLWGGCAVAVALLALATSVFFAARSMPGFASLMSSQQGQTIVVHARDGSEIVSLGPSYGEWLDSDEIPQVMKDAMVAVEDRRFYYHPGVDPVGVMRAVFVALRDGRRMRATSTITQQLARNVFLNSNRTFDRKLREAVLAMALEAKFSKDQILELYLNKVYFGGGAYGIDSASRRFFSHSARELSTAEAAIIAGMVKAPSRYSPTADVDAAVGRANVVLALMREQGKISASEAAVDPGTVKLQPESGQNAFRYFTDYVLPQLDLLLPDNSSLQPIAVWTTLDPKLQNAAAEAVRKNAPAGAQGALVSLDRDGAILALVGGTDYVKSNYNRATEAVRQPGSAWKLFVYLTALEAGYTPDDAVKDVPVTIGGWSPRNSNGRFVGDVDIRTAFAYSINTVAAQLGNEVGFSNVASMARRFGITTPIATNPSMVLGTNEVRVIDLTRAFASVSAGGRSIEPYGITRVETASGEVLYQHQAPRAYQLVPDYVAAGITDLLQTAVNTGTGRAAQIGRPVAGKTGTTSSNKDGWFVGFSSGVTTGVWMGRDDAKAVGGLQGGTAPARAFSQYMRTAVRDRPIEEFDTDLKLPDWQVEPDDEWMYGDPADEYYYVDEQGNLIQPSGSDASRGAPLPPEGDRPPPPDSRPMPSPGGNAAPPAASDEFLERATGRDIGEAPRGASPGGPPVQIRRPAGM